VVIDFSGPEGAREAAEACALKGAALVSGTTGLDAAAEAAMTEAATRVAVLRAANFSLGVLALRRVLATALQCVPHDWDIEIVERHHRQKLDSPSGTALALARDAAALRGQPAPDLRHGRQGRVGPRAQSEIGVHAVRGGTWIGDHEVLLAGANEWLELRHVAQDRGAFARGALAAARFVVTAAPGLYTLDHLLLPPS
jgi:4-hydroxy-tetrahydrodipicolinate reductase